MQRILVPIDGSEGANKAAAFAAKIARDSGASVELMYVYDAPTVAQVGLEAVSRDQLKKLQQSISAGSVNGAKAAMAEVLGDTAIEVVEHTLIGHPAVEIVGHAKSRGHDLIVMGCRGQSQMKELLLGSVSQQVLHHATCPVTVVR